MNSVILIGRLTKDPELKYIPESQMAVATFNLAVDRPMAKEKTADFIGITVFGKTAEHCAKYLAKGRLAGIQGQIQTGSYKSKDGETRYTTRVVASRAEFLEWGNKDQGGGHQQSPMDLPEGILPMEDDDDQIPF